MIPGQVTAFIILGFPLLMIVIGVIGGTDAILGLPLVSMRFFGVIAWLIVPLILPMPAKGEKGHLELERPAVLNSESNRACPFSFSISFDCS